MATKWLHYTAIISSSLPPTVPSVLSLSLLCSPSLPQISKKVVKDSGLVDEETAGAIGSVADAVENQAEAGRDASVTDRLKMAG